MLLGTADGHCPVWQRRPCPLRLCLQYTIFHQYLYIPLLWHKDHKQPKLQPKSKSTKYHLNRNCPCTDHLYHCHAYSATTKFLVGFLIKEVGFSRGSSKQEELSLVLALFRETISLASIPSKKLPSPLGSNGNPKTLRGTPLWIACFRDDICTRFFCK